MSTYISTNRDITLKDNFEINDVYLTCHRHLKNLIIDNLPNLKRVDISLKKGMSVSITNCKRLNGIYIHNTADAEDDELYNGSYFYLGNNMKSLHDISISYFDRVEIENDTFDDVRSLHFTHINNLICNFKMFPKLQSIRLDNVNANDLEINTNVLSSPDTVYEILMSIVISYCSFGNIMLAGNGKLSTFVFDNNVYKSFQVENPLNVEYLKLYNYSYNKQIFPYIPLCDVERFNVNDENPYDSRYKSFIKSNLSKMRLSSIVDREDITLDDIEFY